MTGKHSPSTLKGVDMYVKGISFSKIASALKRDRRSITRSIKAALGIEDPKGRGKLCLELRKQGLTTEDIARCLGLSTCKVKEVLLPAVTNERRIPSSVPTSLDRTIEERKAISKLLKPGRWVLWNDAHVPFHSEQVIEAVLSLKGDYNGIVAAGDIGDAYWFGRFPKTEEVEGYASEAEKVRSLELLLQKKFGLYVKVLGNHGQRRFKMLTGIVEELKKHVPAGDSQEDTRVQVAVNNLDHQVRQIWKESGPGVLVVSGDFVEFAGEKCVVGHPDNYVATPGATVHTVVQHFLNHKHTYRLPNLDLVAIGHTHGQSGPKKRLGVWGWELPAGCGMLPYQASGKLTRGCLDTGFAILTIRPDGRFWFNESRTILLED